MESNKLIAEFMKLKNLKDDKGDAWDFMNTGKSIYTLRTKDLRYNLDWNWLMQVVEKIESLEGCDYIKISPNTIEIQARLKKGVIFRPALIDVLDSKIEAVYNACVSFIKWYNLQNK